MRFASRRHGTRLTIPGVGAITVALVIATSPAGASDATPSAELELLDLPLEDLLSLPLVESVSLRDQGLLEAPASVTVIREDQIRASGATNLAEILRLVPGMHVMQLTGNTYSIGLRGISRPSNDRVLILIDGHPYRDFVTGEARLGSIHVNPMDVVKIEVIRGPGSVIYGAGALSGVVNIVTKSPGGNGTLDASSWGALGVVGSEGGSGKTMLQNSGGARVVLSLKNRSENMGARIGLTMNNLPEWPNQAASEGGMTGRASIQGSHNYSLFGSGRYWGSGNLQMNAEVFHTATEDIGISDISNLPVTFKVSTQQVSYRVEKRRILDLLDTSLSVRGRRSSTTSPPSTVQPPDGRTYWLDAQLKVTLGLFDKRNMTTAAYGASHTESHGFFCAPSMNTGGLILSNDTYLLARRLVLSLGARHDAIRSQDSAFGRIAHFIFSYRGALTYRFSEEHALRLSASSSFRPPTPYETFADVRSSAVTTDAASALPPVRFVIGNPMLVPEQVVNIEAGYRARMLGMLHADVAVFGQKVANLIANDPSNGIPAFKINRFNYQQLGFEMGLRFYPTASTSAYLNYAFVYGKDSDTGARIKEFPTHIAGAGVEVRLPWHARLSMDSYCVFDYQPNVTHLNPGVTLPVLYNERRSAADQVLVNLRAGRILFRDAIEVFVMGKNIAGLWRGPSSLRMYPIESVQPIGATLLAGVIVNTN